MLLLIFPCQKFPFQQLIVLGRNLWNKKNPQLIFCDSYELWSRVLCNFVKHQSNYMQFKSEKITYNALTVKHRARSHPANFLHQLRVYGSGKRLLLIGISWLFYAHSPPPPQPQFPRSPHTHPARTSAVCLLIFWHKLNNSTSLWLSTQLVPVCDHHLL